MLGKIGQRNVRRPFSHHQVHCDQALEDDSPCRVVKSMLERSENLAYAGFTGMRRY